MKLSLAKLSKRTRLTALAVAVGVVVLGGASAYAASSNALPGSPLYPLKRVWEEGRLLLAFSPATEAKTRLDIAHNRIKAAVATPHPTTVIVPALQVAQQQLNSALNQSNQVSDPAQRKAIKDGISKEAADAEAELEHSAEAETASPSDKHDAKDTADKINQIHTQAASGD